MSAIGNLVVNFLGNAKPLQGTLASVRSMLGGLAGTLAATFGAGISIEAAREDIAAQKKLQAVLTATGYAAGLTAGNIRELATELQNTTNFADETTVAAAAVLATFKTIKGDQFKDTLKVAQDLATVFDMDLTSATTKLGKALQDPIHGIGSLHKVGIAFTESQKAMIKSLVDSGDLMGAQKYILESLKGSFGGAAEAMASPFKILHNVLKDIGEEIGKSLLAPMKLFAQTVLPFFREWGSEIARTALAVLALAAVLKTITAVQKAISIGQAMILSLGGPAGWASLAAGAAIFAGSLALVNAQFGKMQQELDAKQAGFAEMNQRAGFNPGTGLKDTEFTRKEGDTSGTTKEQDRLRALYEIKSVFGEIVKAEEAFGGADKLPWFIREGIQEKVTGVKATIAKLRDEILILGGMTRSNLDIANLNKPESGLTADQAKDIEDLIRKRDLLGEQAELMKKLKSEAEKMYKDTLTPAEKLSEELEKINELFEKGLIDETTRDRAIIKANEDALGKKHEHLADAIAAQERGGHEALSTIFAAQRTGAGGNTQQQIADATKRAADAAEEANVVLEEIAGSTEDFGNIEFGVGSIA